MPNNKNPFSDPPATSEAAHPHNMKHPQQGHSINFVHAQNKAILNHLQRGNTINFLQARDLGITHLNNRIEELINQGVPVYSRSVRISGVRCEEYSLKPFR